MGALPALSLSLLRLPVMLPSCGGTVGWLAIPVLLITALPARAREIGLHRLIAVLRRGHPIGHQAMLQLAAVLARAVINRAVLFR